ncbi:MAG: RNA polymerase factor sigma-32 [Hyphomicrobiales bacterium]|nr:RNA polymerase factor sigma-32 [Hyphomicrobiales bacterium]
MSWLVGVGNQFIKAAMQAPYLERDEEHGLALRWKEQHDQAALHRLTESHMRLVVSIAGRFKNYGLPATDLIQEGHIGLLEAAARFDPAREVRFSTYATWWIRAAIQDYVLRNWSIVRGGTSSAQKALFFNLRRMRARLLDKPGQGSTAEMFKAIATTLGVSPGDVEWMNLRLSGGDVSLNAQVGSQDEGEGSERLDFMIDASPRADQLVEEGTDQAHHHACLQQALATLNPREREIVQRRRLEETGQTLEELGAQLGISKERVRQIEVRALEKLRQSMMAQGVHTL